MSQSKWVKKSVVFMLLSLNAIVWFQAGPALVNVCIDDDGALTAPPLLFETEALQQLPDHIKGDGIGKTRLLYHDYLDVYGYNYIPRDQGVSSSCVGQSAACAVDILGAVETKAGLRNLPPPPRSSASWIYGCSREVGGIENRGRGSYSRLAARSLEEVGFVYEENFFMLGYDLTGDNALRDMEFRHGIPEQLKPLGYHRIAGYYELHSYEDVRDAIYNGMPVIVGSSVGFGRTDDTIWRDSDGFLSQPFFKFRGRYWPHALCFIGVCDQGRRGVLCMNSWGEYWVDGPQRFGDEPLGSFWIDDTIIERMVAHDDCFAIYGLQN